MNGPALQLHGVRKAFGEGAARRTVLAGIDLTVADGEFVAIVGGSGAGKSTLLGLLAGLLRPDAGTVAVHGQPVVGPGAERGVVFQHYSLLPWLTVHGNVLLAVDQAFPRESRAARASRVDRLLDLVHLGAARAKYPRELSGGMQQRVAIARAFATEPAILLLDEPFGALDALTRGLLQTELERLWQQDRKCVVMVSNDIEEALRLADRIVPLRSDGTLGAPVAVPFARPRQREALQVDAVAQALRAELAAALGARAERAATPVLSAETRAAAAAGTAPVLRLRGVGKSFATPRGRQEIVRAIDLELADGEIVGLLGHSGCGKTTVLSMVAGLTKPDAGTIDVGGKPIDGPGLDRGLVFQQHSLLPWLSALDNVLLAVQQARPDLSAMAQRHLAAEQLERVGLGGQLGSRPVDLSAGMRQRVGVARAFALQPRLLLLDEPFGSLDSLTRGELQAVLLDLLAASGTAALLVTHDIDEALLLCDRIVLMTDGPSATIGDVLAVDAPRPRRQSELGTRPEFQRLRARMLAFLARTTSRANAVPEPIGAG